MPARKRPDVVARARQLIRRRKLYDKVIARQMTKEGKPISGPSVRKQRTAMGLPPLLKKGLPQATIVRARQLIRRRKLSDEAIARQMTKEGKPISGPSVRKQRTAMGLPPLLKKGLPPATVERARQLTAYRNIFRALREEERITRWDLLNRKWRLIKNRIDTIKGGRKHIEKGAQARINPLLDQLADIGLQREALWPLLPKEIQRAEVAAFARLIKNSQ